MENILDNCSTGPMTLHEAELAKIMIKAMTNVKQEIVITHVFSHNSMWLNEIADNIILKTRMAIPILGLSPNSPLRLPRYMNQTKNELKLMYREDENLFWGTLTRYFESTTGHIRHTLGITYQKVKQTQNLLAGNKRAQSEFNKMLAGATFKQIRGNVLITPPCPRCVAEPLTWEHFFLCFGLGSVSVENLQKVETWAFLAQLMAEYNKQ